MNNYRPPAVAGSFYPDDTQALQRLVDDLLNKVDIYQTEQRFKAIKPKAIIVPHAGYIYSGLTAAYAFKSLKKFKQQIKRVIVFGPSHHVALEGMAVPSTDSFMTPLGQINLDKEEIKQLSQLAQITVSDIAHEQEHSLEVQLPFLQHVLADFKLVPIVVGQSPIELTSIVIDRYINNPSDLVVISTDLSHFLNDEQAQVKDNKTATNILNKNIQALSHSDACGYMPLVGLLQTCQNQSLNLQLLDQCNSAKTSANYQRVVGYGSWGVYNENE